MNVIRNYIIIDDDPVSNSISNMRIKKTLGNVKTKIFLVPEDGLAFIQHEYPKAPEHTILLLDINMPTLTAWEFLEHYENFSETVKQQISIYIVSSSVDQRDKDKAHANKHVKGFISKPLTCEWILSLAKGEVLASKEFE